MLTPPVVSGGIVAPQSVEMPKKVLRAVTYSRLSTDDSESASLDIQEERCVQRCVENGHIVVGMFRENFTGMLYRERPQLSKMRMMIRNGEVDVVVIHSVERLSRVTLHIAVILEEMLSHNVQLECVTEQIDTSPIGQMVIQLLALAGQIERERILERTSRERKKRYEAGQMVGTGTSLFGYMWGDKAKTHYIIDPEQAEIVSLIFYLYVSTHLSICQICHFLNERGVKTPGYIRSERAKESPRSRKTLPKNYWRPTIVARILGHPGYKGQALVKVQGKALIEGKIQGIRHQNPIELPEGTIPPIILVQDWEETQRLKKLNKLESQRNAVEEEDGLLLKHGIVRCGYCGGSMTKSRMHNSETHGPWYIYQCHRRGKMGRIACPRTPSISTRIMDKAVWEFVSSLFHRAQQIQTVLMQEAASIIVDTDEIDASMEKTQALILRILQERRGLEIESLAFQSLTEELLKHEETLKKLKSLKDQAIPAIEQAKDQAKEIEEFLQWLTAVSDPETATLEEKRRAIRMFGIQVFVYQKEDTAHPRYRIQIRKELQSVGGVSPSLYKH